MSSVRDDGLLFEMGEPLAAGEPVGSAKMFRAHNRGQSFLMPPSLDDWLPEDHPARFIGEVVDELLDLGEVYASYVSASGAPPYECSQLRHLAEDRMTTEDLDA